MFKKPTKKQYLIQRIIFSIIAVTALLIIVTLAILSMMGYRLDSDKGRLEQGALLQFDSKPSGADVYVDDSLVSGKTATKQTVVAGVHTVVMKKDGYRDWTRTLNTAAGTLTWLDYTRFVPTKLTVQKVATYQTLTGAKMSPDNKWALLQEKSDTPTFQLADLRSSDVKITTLTLPATSYSEADTPDVTHSFSIVSWDENGRYVLLKHIYKDQTEWLVLDSQDQTKVTNITQMFSTGFSDIQFAGTDGKVFYALANDGAIRRIDLSAETMSRAVVTHAESFTLYDNKIVSYVGIDPSDATKRVAGIYRDGDENSHVLRSVISPSTDMVLKIAITTYHDDYYVAIAEDNVVTVLKGGYPSADDTNNDSLESYATFEISGSVSALSFSEDGDYVLAQSGETFKSYEIEHKRAAAGTITVNEGDSAPTLHWLDEAHLWSNDSGTLVMRDFNGDNAQSIMTIATGFDASLSQSGRYFYGIGKDDAGYHLQRVKMILD